MRKFFSLVLLFVIILFSGLSCAKDSKDQKNNEAESLSKKGSQIAEKTQNLAFWQEMKEKSAKIISANQKDVVSNLVPAKEEEKIGRQQEIPSKKQIRVSLILDFGIRQKNFSIDLDEGETVYHLLSKAMAEGKISFQAKSYDFGVFIEEIGGVKNDEKQKKYWMFYVNDKLSRVGASLKKLNDRDKVTWKYQKSAL